MEMTQYIECDLCPRKCMVDRRTTTGFCGETSRLFAARAALHFWEEPPISGENGSGTVFFRGCNLRCIYCQNYSIAHNDGGVEITADKLSDIYIALQEKGAHNINLVTPTHFSPHVVSSVNNARQKGLNVPIVYNTSGYERKEIITQLDNTVDIFLTDFKYIKNETAQDYSSAPDYFQYAQAALEKMVEMKPLKPFENGLMKQGVIVRHLLLPNHLIEAKLAVKYLYEKYKNRIYISLMNQYTPIREFKKHPELNRRVLDREYKSLIKYAEKLGVVNAFIQEGDTAKESFIPPFVADCPDSII